MKKLSGIKKGFSSLENKRLSDLKSINGGKAEGGTTKTIQSNVSSGPNCVEVDHYDDNGTYTGRVEVC